MFYDVIIKIYRYTSIDLQKEEHKDMNDTNSKKLLYLINYYSLNIVDF